MTTVAAFDPGLSGAVAISSAESFVIVNDLPIIGAGKQRLIDGGALARYLRSYNIEYAVIEQVASMPKQGVSSTFKFGTVFGQLIGVVQCLGIPHEFVRPNEWKKKMRLGADKEIVRRRAIEQYPKLGDQLARKMDHNRAEALMMIKWYLDR